MRTLIEGTSKHLSQRETEDVLWFYAKKLMSPQLCKHLTIVLRFKNIKGLKGLCDTLEITKKPRDFEITIRPTMSRKNQLLTIAHEMVHVKQFARQEMGILLQGNAVSWQGKLYEDTDENYWAQPWEIEAYGREIGLYMMYCNHLKTLNRAMYPRHLDPDFFEKPVDIDLDL